MMESSPSTLQEKCFLKCFGEGTDMVRPAINFKLSCDILLKMLYLVCQWQASRRKNHRAVCFAV